LDFDKKKQLITKKMVQKIVVIVRECPQNALCSDLGFLDMCSNLPRFG